MLPTSVSQVLEAVVKLIVGDGRGAGDPEMTNEIPLAAGGAILGVTASCLVSAIYLFGRFRKSYALLPRTEEEPRSYRETARGLLAIAIPITFGSCRLAADDHAGNQNLHGAAAESGLHPVLC